MYLSYLENNLNCTKRENKIEPFVFVEKLQPFKMVFALKEIEVVLWSNKMKGKEMQGKSRMINEAKKNDT
jgi:hypothetical protein